MTYQFEYFQQMPLKSLEKAPILFHSNAGIFLNRAEANNGRNKKRNFYETGKLCKSQIEGF